MKLLVIAFFTFLGLLAVLILGEILPTFPQIGTGYEDWVSGGLFLFMGTVQLVTWWRRPPGKFAGLGPWWAAFTIAVGFMNLFSHSGPLLRHGADLLVLSISTRAIVVEWRKVWWSGLAVGALWATFLVATMTDALSVPVPRTVERAAIWTLLCIGAAWLIAKARLAFRRKTLIASRSEL